jgi:hypothetical protein
MTSSDLRCPQCSAHISPDAGWCTLCYADLRPPVAPPPLEAGPEPDPAAELAADADPGVDIDQDGRGKHARSATAYDDAVPRQASAPLDEASAAEFEARANEMLAMLAAESGRPLGQWADRLDTTASRVVAGLIGLVVLATAGLLVMTVLGHFV